MNADFWAPINHQLQVWRTGALPGLAVMGCIVLARLTGALQVSEWMAFDQLLKLRPVEAQDARVVIVKIDEVDIRAVGNYPIPDRDLARLIRILQRYQPRAIGLDIFRDLTGSSDRSELSQVLATSSNLIGVEVALAGESSLKVKPPPELSPGQIGFVDMILDPDGKLRRIPLVSKVDSGEVKYSLALRLAERYLNAQGIALEPGPRASSPVQFGATELPRFRSHTGGYVNAAAGGNQILLNFRSSPAPFLSVSLLDVFSGKVNPEWIRDRVVLIGMTASSVNDTFMTSATKGTLLTTALGGRDNQYQLIHGVELQAHATSQIIHAVLDGRSLLQSWSESWEYVWVLTWGLGGIALGLLLQSPWKTLLSLGLSSAGLITTCYGLLVLGWWVPLTPALLTLWGAGLTTSLFDQRSRTLLEQRTLILQRTYDAVHNGPLQTLASILRGLGDEDDATDKLRLQLRALNHELRSVYESMNQVIQTDERYKKTPIQELLYQIYEDTLQRDLPGFASIKTFFAPDFSALRDCSLTIEQKQALCIFLQEAICNVGKHAVEATRLDVVCDCQQQVYRLQIIDDGKTLAPATKLCPGGRGTSQALELARHLGGRFARSHNSRGTICELVWSDKRWL